MNFLTRAGPSRDAFLYARVCHSVSVKKKEKKRKKKKKDLQLRKSFTLSH